VAATQYRFLPWARRGLADRVGGDGDDGSRALPARAKVSVGLTISSLTEVTRDLSLYGPGDVVGVDPKLIVHTSPRAGSTDVEPNYFAQIEFDPPDFPWLFTPARAGADDRLRPWCVLVVVDLAVVDAPRTARGQPLPVLSVPRAAVAVELPDLGESWAWAHAQAVAPAGAADLARELADNPALNVSRILAPRRLEPGKRYAACLVPAFDAGVERGLGGVPAANAQLRPAWTAAGDADVRLPVYFHWEFATGPQGDFESLARRLQPFRAPAQIGVEPMYVGDAGPGLPAVEPGAPGSTLEMDGALRSPQRSSGTLADVPPALRDALRATLDAAAEQAASGPDAAAPAFGPPIHGAFHANQHTIPDDLPAWLRELNLDPRARAAAGLGVEIERANQEDFMQWCWEQVGRILEANRLMSRARLSLEVLARVHGRHVAPLPADRLFALAAPLHSRTPQAGATLTQTIARSSLADAATDPALRRLTSPRRPMLRAALARAGAPAGQPRVRLAAGLATGALEVDPTRFTPDGVQAAQALAGVAVPATGDAPVSLAAAGLPITVPAALLRRLRGDLDAIAQDRAPRVLARADLRTKGLLGAEHLERARELLSGDTTPGLSLTGTLGTVRASPLAGSGTIALILGPDGQAVVARPVAERPDRRRPEVRQPDVLEPDRRPPLRPPVVLPQPVRDGVTIARFERALERAAPAGQIGPAAPERRLVAFDMALAATTLVTRTDPRGTVPRRLRTMLVAGDRASLLDDPPAGVTVAPMQDRVMAAPEIDLPVYEHLARLDPARFLPGVGDIPVEAITLLETNPRFVEALLVGLNGEMNRELLWREFPTDQRGTPFRSFWRWTDGAPDIRPIHTWSPGASLGAGARGGPGGQIALLVRGRLLRRYPNTVIYAWRSAADGTLRNPPAPDDLRMPAFAGVLGDDIAFVGFNLTDTELTAGAGWFFVLQEQPTEPRFGFDELGRAPAGASLPPLTSWSDATWEHTATAPGGYLKIADSPLADMTVGGARFVDHSAHLAAIALQKPFRVAVHARSMVEEAPRG